MRFIMRVAQGERKVQVRMTLLIHVGETLLVYKIMFQNPSGIKTANILNLTHWLFFCASFMIRLLPEVPMHSNHIQKQPAG